MRGKPVLLFGTLTLALGALSSSLSCHSDQPVNECHGCSDAQACCYFFVYASVDPDSGQVRFASDAGTVDIVTNATCGTLIDGGEPLINGLLDGATGECALYPPE